MLQLLIGSLVLSILHASIPNHWIPLVLISKTEKWSRSETLWMTALIGSLHTISTIIVGIIVGMVGYKLSSTSEFITRIVAPSVLIILGLVYLIVDLKHSHHHHNPVEIDSTSKRSKFMIITSLGIAMFFSPCLEIEAYYFTAGGLGLFGITIVSIVYFIVTILGMLLLVDLGLKGVEKLKWHFLEHHEKKIMGAVLIGLGILVYFLEI